MTEVESVIWCPSCGVDKYEVQRIPTGNEGVFVHRAEPAQAYVDAQARGGKCGCGAILQRKNNGS